MRIFLVSIWHSIMKNKLFYPLVVFMRYFIETREWIRNNMPFYKLYVRHYSYAWTETILYAIYEKEEKNWKV